MLSEAIKTPTKDDPYRNRIVQVVWSCVINRQVPDYYPRFTGKDLNPCSWQLRIHYDMVNYYLLLFIYRGLMKLYSTVIKGCHG